MKRKFDGSPGRFGVGAIIVVGAAVGIILWTGYNAFVEYTNTIDFCISCHEMRDTVYAEYRKSKHYSNGSGVRASCSDCHIPRGWDGAMARSSRTVNDLYHKLIGSIDTKEKFEARRMQLAEAVWRSMKSSDSRECRNCHSFEAMDFHDQSRRAGSKMKAAMKKRKSCIECHKGIAHKLPPEYDEDDD